MRALIKADEYFGNSSASATAVGRQPTPPKVIETLRQRYHGRGRGGGQRGASALARMPPQANTRTDKKRCE